MSRSEVPARCKLAVIFVYWGWRGVTTSDGWLHSLWRYCRACSTANSRIDVTAWHVIYSCNDELSSFVMCSQWTQKLMPLTYIQHFNDHFPGEPGLISQPTDFLSQWFLCIQIISEKVKIFHILPTSTHPVFLGCPPSSSTYLYHHTMLQEISTVVSHVHTNSSIICRITARHWEVQSLTQITADQRHMISVFSSMYESKKRKTNLKYVSIICCSRLFFLQRVNNGLLCRWLCKIFIQLNLAQQYDLRQTQPTIHNCWQIMKSTTNSVSQHNRFLISFTNLQLAKFAVVVLNNLRWQVIQDLVFQSSQQEWKNLPMQRLHCQHTYVDSIINGSIKSISKKVLIWVLQHTGLILTRPQYIRIGEKL